MSASVDDRTEEERGLKVSSRVYQLRFLGLNVEQPLKESRFRMPKSRYASVSLYISDVWFNRPEYNDINAPYDQAIYDRLIAHGKWLGCSAHDPRHTDRTSRS